MSWLIYLLAAIGLFAVCAAAVLALFIGLQLTTTDNFKPRKPWWWRF